MVKLPSFPDPKNRMSYQNIQKAHMKKIHILVRSMIKSFTGCKKYEIVFNEHSMMQPNHINIKAYAFFCNSVSTLITSRCTLYENM